MTHYYQLKKVYPGSPELGFIVNETMSEYYTYEPEKWLQFWEKIPISDVLFISEDGEKVKKGQTVYYIDAYGNIASILAHPTINQLKYKYFTNYLKASEYIIKSINLKIENETIVSENIILYGVLTKGDWQLCETNSYKLFYRLTPQSTCWKYFRTKEEREEYIFKNKPRFSFKDILDIQSKVVLGGEIELTNIIKENYE